MAGAMHAFGSGRIAAICMQNRLLSAPALVNAAGRRRALLFSTAAAPAAAAEPSSSSGPTSTSRQPTTNGFQQAMRHARQTQVAQELWAQVLRPGCTAVDATCGNGHDTLFLAQAVGPGGSVCALDIQSAALDATRAAVEGALSPAERPDMEYALSCHSRILDWVDPGSARLVCFNLGYLPGGDKSVITTPESTLAAVGAACTALGPGGLLSALCYTGHPGGQEEYEAVRNAMAALAPREWTISEFRVVNRPAAPVLLLAWRKG